MKKKLVSILMVLALVFTLLPVATIANNDITVTIDGVPVVFEGQGPVIIGGRTLVPVRGVFEALGFYPTWDRDTRTATLTREDFVVVLTVGSRTFTTNGESFTLDVAPQIIEERTLLPLRAVLESVGYNDMVWIGSTRTVVIRTGTVTQPTPTPIPTATPTPTPVATPTPTPEPTPIPDNDWLNASDYRLVWTANRTSVVIHSSRYCSSMSSPVQWTRAEALARPNGGRPCQNCWVNRGS